MGLPTIPDPTCVNCLTCHSEGETPCKKYISFTGIVSCEKLPGVVPPPFNSIVRVNQIEDHECEYERLFDDDLYFRYNSAILNGSQVEQEWFIWGMFLKGRPNNCETQFANTLTCAGPGNGEGGNAAVTWNTGPSDHAIGSLLNSINMEPHAETKYEFWPASEERMVVKFARKSDATNILILVEPENL